MTNKQYAMELIIRNIKDAKESKSSRISIDRDLDRSFDEGFIDLVEEKGYKQKSVMDNDSATPYVMEIENDIFDIIGVCPNILIHPCSIEILL